MTFQIDVLQSLYDLAVKQNPDIPPEKIKETLGTDNFKAIYTLYGKSDACFPDCYTLTDTDGNRIKLDDLNGFEKSIINSCFSFWYNPEKHMDDMFGVLEATEEELEDE